MASAVTSPRLLLIEGNDLQRDAVTSAASLEGAFILSPPLRYPVLQLVSEARPDCLFLDGDLPDEAGYEALADIRSNRDLAKTRVVMVTADDSPAGRGRAYAGGADEVLRKPYTLHDLLAAESTVDRFQVNFWGVRGSLPVPGADSLKYGGNTSCISLDIGRDRHFVFDAGTGLRNYSRHLLERQGGRFKGRIFISHPHWDHLNCLPFFAPIYIPGNWISLMGPPQGNRSFRNLIDTLMDGVLFPITVEVFGADVTFTDLHEGEHRFDGVKVRTMSLRHPGYCLGFRIDHRGRSVAYITDNELGNIEAGDSYLQRLSGFLSGVDVLIHDATYFDDEYPRKVSWGHSSISQVVTLADAAKASTLFLFHHDPEHRDHEIDLKLDIATKLAAEMGSEVRCINAREGERWNLSESKSLSKAE